MDWTGADDTELKEYAVIALLQATWAEPYTTGRIRRNVRKSELVQEAQSQTFWGNIEHPRESIHVDPRTVSEIEQIRCIDVTLCDLFRDIDGATVV